MEKAERLHFLDGLRGWAALAVVLGHVFLLWLLNAEALTSSGHSYLLTIINASPLGILMDGLLAVHIFFVISGFALSYPVLVSSRKTRTLLSLAAFRYQRLAIPIFFSCMLTFALWGSLRHKEVGLLPTFYDFAPTWTSLFKFSLYEVFFNFSFDRTWNPVLWTMRTELYGSFAVFLLLAVVPYRALRLIIAAIWAVYYSSTGYACFPVGYLIAELLFIDRRRSEILGSTLIVAATGGAIFCHVNSVANTIVMNSIAAAALSGIVLSEASRDFLSNGVSRFLGKISFALYLVHVPLLCSFGVTVYFWVSPFYGLLGTSAIVGPIVIAAVILLAYIFDVIIDDRIVGAAKRLTSKIVDKAIATLPMSGFISSSHEEANTARVAPDKR